MEETTTTDLSSLRIDRGSRRRRRRNPWPGRILLLAILGGGAWLFQRPIVRFIEGVRLPEVEVSPLVRTNPATASGAEGAASNGYVIARTRAALSAERPGRIVEMNVVEGSRMNKGDVVARLDSSEQEARLESARAGLEFSLASVERAGGDVEAAVAEQERITRDVPRFEANLDSARSDAAYRAKQRARIQGLVDKGISEMQELDQAIRDDEQAKAAVAAAEAALGSASASAEAAGARTEAARRALKEAEAGTEQARAAVVEAEAALEKTYVRAPFDGVVVLKEAEVGEVVSPNSQGGSNARGSVATMVDFASLEVQAEVPETTLAAVVAGGPAKIYLDAFPREPYEGRIDRIWPTADRTKATVEVRVAFVVPDERLRPDMGVRVVFLEEEPEADAPPAEELLLIPRRALVEVDGERGTFVLRDRGVVRFQAVQVGESTGNRVRVEAGLDGTEEVVLDPPTDLVDGARVRRKE